MTTMIALVSGFYHTISDRLPMADLRRQAELVGLKRVVSYQSTGNLVFDSDARPEDIEEELAFGIFTCGFDATVVVRTSDELAQIIGANPFGEILNQTSRFHLFVLEREFSSSDRTELEAMHWGEADVRLRNREAYACVDVHSNRVFTNFKRFERTSGNAAAVKNWNTVKRLHQLCQDR